MSDVRCSRPVAPGLTTCWHFSVQPWAARFRVNRSVGTASMATALHRHPGSSRWRTRMCRELLAIVALAVAMPHSAGYAVQDPVQLRFQPPLGSGPPMSAELRMKLIWIGLPTLPDSTPVEVNNRMMLNLRVVERRGIQHLVQWTLDSTRIRVKIGDGARNDVSLPTVQHRGIRLLMDERARIVAAPGLNPGSTIDSSYILALQASASGFEATLPDEPVTVGGSWTLGTRFRIGPELGAATGFTTTALLPGRMTVTLDSLVPRGADPLAYLSTEGTLSNTIMPVKGPAGSGTATLAGAFAGALLWSTSWSNYVSSAANVNLQGRLKIDQGDNPFEAVMLI